MSQPIKMDSGLPPREWNHPETVAFRQKYGKPVYTEAYERGMKAAVERESAERMKRIAEIGALVLSVVEMFKLFHNRRPTVKEQEALALGVEILFLGGAR